MTCEYGFCVNGKCECDPRIPFCTKESQCGKEVVCQNGGTCVDVIEKSGRTTLSKCLCPPGLSGKFCEQSIYCALTHTFPCGTQDQCKSLNGTYECRCDKPFIGHGCSKRKSDFVPEFESFLSQEKSTRIKNSCKFGSSRESIIFLMMVIVFLLMFAFIAFLIGHFLTISYRKRYMRSHKSKSNNSSIEKHLLNLSDERSKELNQPKLIDLFGKTPIMDRSRQKLLNESTGSFSIPRPSVRLTNMQTSDI